MKIAVLGAGWAGLAAAVTAVQGGATVSLYEMAPLAGGRARDVVAHEHAGRLDNGQHICIGAYVETLRLMRSVGVDPEQAFLRLPLTLVEPDGSGLRLRSGPPLLAFAAAVLRHGGWRLGDKLSLLDAARRWRGSGFRCSGSATVADLSAGISATVRRSFIEPLCVAALNTPAAEASGQVFLRVLRDSLTAGSGSADLLLPRVGLGSVLPGPALEWLQTQGVSARLAHRAEVVEPMDGAVMVDGERHDRVVVATSALEAARLLARGAPAWAEKAAAFAYEPIVTVYAESVGCRLSEPMLALPADADRPAQFVFDRGQLGGPAGQLAFVISGAAPWVERGSEATAAATLAQAKEQLGAQLRAPIQLVRTIVEKRATFRCVPGLARPPLTVVAGVVAAGDYIDGPYPATLEGAVRSGVAAARAALA